MHYVTGMQFFGTLQENTVLMPLKAPALLRDKGPYAAHEVVTYTKSKLAFGTDERGRSFEKMDFQARNFMPLLSS